MLYGSEEKRQCLFEFPDTLGTQWCRTRTWVLWYYQYMWGVKFPLQINVDSQATELLSPQLTYLQKFYLTQE